MSIKMVGLAITTGVGAPRSPPKIFPLNLAEGKVDSTEAVLDVVVLGVLLAFPSMVLIIHCGQMEAVAMVYPKVIELAHKFDY